MQILTNLQISLLNLFTTLLDKDAFYLTGGTALSAFFLRHRKSHDLDFFTNTEEIILPFTHKLEASLKNEKYEVERLRGFHSFVELFINSADDSTMVHFAL